MNIVDIFFTIQGEKIPVDHGYNLYSAISRIIPEIHKNKTWGIHAIPGQLIGNRLLSITKKSFLIIRLPADEIIKVLPLAGKTLCIKDHKITVGIPRTEALIPSVKLYSRLVVIKGAMEPESFIASVKKQLKKLNIKGVPYLVEQPNIVKENQHKTSGTKSLYLRRTLSIKGLEIVGFALMIEELTAEESIILQEKGIGGKRSFGCGIFISDRR